MLPGMGVHPIGFRWRWSRPPGSGGRTSRGWASILSDFGEHLDCDSKAVDSHGQTSRKSAKTFDLDADWGKHETVNVDGKPANFGRK